MKPKRKEPTPALAPRLLFYTGEAALPPEAIARLVAAGVVPIQVGSLDAVRLMEPMPQLIGTDEIAACAAMAINATVYDDVRTRFGRLVAGRVIAAEDRAALAKGRG